MSNSNYDVFISYRRESGSAEARLIQRSLAESNLRVFLDITDLKRGYFDEALLTHIADAPSFIVILSPNALDRCVEEQDWLRREIAQAIKTQKNIIPILMPDFKFPSELPLDIRELSRYQGLEYSNRWFDAMIADLVQNLEGEKADRAERLARGRAEQEQREREKAEADRKAQEQAEALERAKAEHLREEKEAEEKREQERAEQEAREREEKEKLARDAPEAERRAKEGAELAREGIEDRRAESLCMGCMANKGSSPTCPNCGWEEGRAAESPVQLPPRTILAGTYLVGRALGQGGFGITYLAWDLNLNCKVAMKEYFPTGVCTRGKDERTVRPLTSRTQESFEYGLRKFLEEGQALARFRDHPGIVSVLGFFQENGTAYLVMGYIEGETFKQYLEEHDGKIPFPSALSILTPVMDALREVHGMGMLHRDISPDNIYLTKNRQVKILDFGAARYAMEEVSQDMSVVLKPGYAPEEQHRRRGRQGAWTDVYALGATFYRAITGKVPSDGPDRLAHDDLVPPSLLGVSIPAGSETALLKALAVRAENRFQSIAEFQRAINAGVEQEAARRRAEQAVALERTRVGQPRVEKEAEEKRRAQEEAEAARQQKAEQERLRLREAEAAQRARRWKARHDRLLRAKADLVVFCQREQSKIIGAGLAAVVFIGLAVAGHFRHQLLRVFESNLAALVPHHDNRGPASTTKQAVGSTLASSQQSSGMADRSTAESQKQGEQTSNSVETSQPGESSVAEHSLADQIASLVKQGDAYYATHDYGKAITQYQQASNLDPGAAEPRAGISRARRALKLQVDTLMSQGDASYRSGDYDAAVSQYQHALGLGATKQDVQTKIGKAQHAKSTELTEGTLSGSAAQDFTLNKAIRLLQGDVPSERMVALAHQNHISFSRTAETAARLRGAGATEELLEAIPGPPPPPPPTARLQVSSSSGSAQVSIDGKVMGATNPQGRLELPGLSVGPHLVAVTFQGCGEPYRQTVNLLAGETSGINAHCPQPDGSTQQLLEVRTFQVTHQHTIGTDQGDLIIGNGMLEYRSEHEGDSFKCPLKQIVYGLTTVGGFYLQCADSKKRYFFSKSTAAIVQLLQRLGNQH